MIKKAAMIFAAAVMAVGITACSSVETATNLNNVNLSANGSDTTLAHLNGEVWGVYLLNLLPLFTGSTSKPGNCEAFRDTVKVENAVRMITKKAANLDATRLTDLYSLKSSLWIFPFTVKAVDVSGNAVK